MILYSQWLKLPISTRIKIASEFGIEKKGSTHVVGNEVQSDGYSVHDIEKELNVAALQAYLNTAEDDLSLLWAELVYRTENPDEIRLKVEDFNALRVTPEMMTIGEVDLDLPLQIKKKGGRPKGSKNK